jgi:hypothetical protein
MRKKDNLKMNKWVRTLIIILLVGVLFFPTENMQAEEINYALRFDGVDDYVDLGIYGPPFLDPMHWRSTKSFVFCG